MATIVLIMESRNDNLYIRCGSPLPVDKTLIGGKLWMWIFLLGWILLSALADSYSPHGMKKLNSWLEGLLDRGPGGHQLDLLSPGQRDVLGMLEFMKQLGRCSNEGYFGPPLSTQRICVSGWRLVKNHLVIILDKDRDYAGGASQ